MLRRGKDAPVRKRYLPPQNGDASAMRRLRRRREAAAQPTVTRITPKPPVISTRLGPEPKVPLREIFVLL